MEEPSSDTNAVPQVSIVVVNWNSGTLLAQCLESCRAALARPGAPSAQIIVVDNASTDQSAAPEMLGEHVELVRNSGNRGFGAACNQAVAGAVSKYVLFLNPDCRVAAGSIEACLARLECDPSIGVVGVALIGDDGKVSRSCHCFPSVVNFLYRLSGLSALLAKCSDGSMTNWAHDSDRRVDHVIGAFYLVRAHEFRAIGGFDERFFVYLEDLDLSLRYRQRGQYSLFVAAPASYHKGGGVSDQARAARLFYATRSRILYAFKHFGTAQAYLHLAATLAVEPLARIVQLLAQGRLREVVEVLGGFALLYRDLPATLRLAWRK